MTPCSNRVVGLIADEWLVGYQEEQARLNARSDALVPLLQDGGLGALGDYFAPGQMLRGYVEQVPQAYEAMKTARNPYTYGIFPGSPVWGLQAGALRRLWWLECQTSAATCPSRRPTPSLPTGSSRNRSGSSRRWSLPSLPTPMRRAETDVGYEPETRLAAAQAGPRRPSLRRWGRRTGSTRTSA